MSSAAKRDFREILKVLVVGLSVMVVLPLAYRVWLHYHPQPPSPRSSLSAFLAKSAEERTMRLIQKPLSTWTEADRKSEPKIHAWLVAHEKTILPWEWTDGAHRKDPAGYRRLWLALVKEQKGALNRRLQDVQKRLKAVERSLWTMETMYAHRTNQIVRVQEYAATNAFPMTVKVERLSKGRFWGWNTKTEEVRLAHRADLDDVERGWMTSEQKTAAKEHAALVADSSAHKALERRLDVVRELLSRTMALEDLAELNDGVCLPELCRFLKTEGLSDED